MNCWRLQLNSRIGNVIIKGRKMRKQTCLRFLDIGSGKEVRTLPKCWIFNLLHRPFLKESFSMCFN